MGSGSKPVEGVKLREAKGRHEGSSGAHGAPAHGTAHAGGQAAVPGHYQNPHEPILGFSRQRVGTAAAHEAAGGQRAVSSSSAAPHEAAGGHRSASSSSTAAAAPHEGAPGGRNQYDNLRGVELLPPAAAGHYTAGPAGGGRGRAATPATAPGGHNQYTPAPSAAATAAAAPHGQTAAAAPAHGQSNYIEMQVLPAHAVSTQPAYNQTSLANALGQTGAAAGATGGNIYHAPPVTGAAAGGHVAGGGAAVGGAAAGGAAAGGAAAGGAGAPGGGGGGHHNNAGHQQPVVPNTVVQVPVVPAPVVHQPTRYERIRDAIRRNPKRRNAAITVGAFVLILSAVGTAVGITKPWEDNAPPSMPPEDNTSPPKPTAQAGSKKLASGANLADESLLAHVKAGSDQAGFEIDASSFTLYKTEMGADEGTSLETDDGTWSVDTEGKLAFTPKATFSGGAADIYFSVKDKKGTGSNRAKFTVQYGPTLHDGALTDQDPKAKSVAYTVANWNAAAMSGAFEAQDAMPNSAFDPATILFFDSAAMADVASLQVDGAGVWSAANGVITFTPVAGMMAQMVFVTYSIKDKSGQASNRATLTISFKPEGMVVDPNNKDMTRVPVISFNAQIAISGKPVSAAVSSDIGLTADSLRIVSGMARVTSLPVSGQGTWTAAGNVLTFTPLDTFRGAPPPVQVTAKSAFGVESAPVTLALKIFALPVVTDDYVSSPYPAIVRPLANDKVGYTMENNALVPSSVEIFAVIATAAGPTVAADRKSATVPGEGTWAVNADGSVTFAQVAGFTGGPKPISYTVADTKGSRSDPAVITLNRQVGDIATRFAAMMMMSQGAFFQNYVNTLGDKTKYSMFDMLDATNQLMLMFIAEAQRLGQYASVQAARMRNQSVLDTETDKAMKAWMATNFSIQGLVDATGAINDALLGLPLGTVTIGTRALRLEIMATLVERYISTMMLVRGKAMQ